MRVGFDGRSLESPAGGVRRYVTQLLAALASHEPDIECVILGGVLGSAVPAGIEHHPVQRWAPSNLGWSLVDLPRGTRGARLDLFHAPSYTAPLYGVHPLVLTIHDISYERHPEWYPYRRDALRRWFYRASARTADVILTDSSFMRSEIAAAYDIPPNRIRVVPLGVGEPFLSASREPIGSLPTGVTKPFVLHVGDLHLRRNLGLLVRALSRFAATHGASATPMLVLAGADRGERASLEGDAARSGIRLCCVGVPDDHTLVSLYTAAEVFVYPSRYEGFGLPILEAMACGTPVVAARTSAIPEVVGDAGILLDPDDDVGFAEALANVMADPGLASRLGDRGRQRAAALSWNNTARMTADVYRAASATPR